MAAGTQFALTCHYRENQNSSCNLKATELFSNVSDLFQVATSKSNLSPHASTSKSKVSPHAGTSKSNLSPPAGTSKSNLSPPVGTSKSNEYKNI